MRAQQTKEELDALRTEVAAKDKEIKRLYNGSADHGDRERVEELEQRIEELRTELSQRSGADQHDDGASDTTNINWNRVARDPFSDQYSDVGLGMDVDDDSDDDHHFGNKTMAELACSTPSRRSEARHSFPTPPSTSPVGTGPPNPFSRLLTPTTHAGVQVDMLDTEKQELEEELASLQLEICKLTTALESYETLEARLSDKLAPFASDDEGHGADASAATIEAHLTTLLQTFSDRTAALVQLNSSISDLGFPGTDASEMIASLSTAFRTARLELEYLTPGEIALPLTSAGSAVLDLLLVRLRHLARRNQESDNAIDEYHALELSLRQQLSARVEAMDGMTREMKKLETGSSTKDSRISELEVGVERLKGAVKTYARDMSEMEKLVTRMEGQVETANANCRKEKADNEADVEGWTLIFNDKESTISTLEGKLATAVLQTAELKEQLASLHTQQISLQTRHKDELVDLNKTHGASLALGDARVAELRLEMDRVNDALREAHESVRQLRVENGSLSARLDAEKAKAKAAINSMRGELERVARMSQDFLATPKKTPGPGPSSLVGKRTRGGSVERGDGMVQTRLFAPVVRPGGSLTGDFARRKSGEESGGETMKKRRKHDSGLGFLGEEDVDA